MTEAEAYRARMDTEQRLMDAVFQFAYLGKPPRGYNPGQDRLILRDWLKRGRSEFEIRDAIEGLRKAVDTGTVEWRNPESGLSLTRGQQFTLRALKNTKCGDLRTWDVAQNAVLHNPEGKMPETLKDVLRKALL